MTLRQIRKTIFVITFVLLVGFIGFSLGQRENRRDFQPKIVNQEGVDLTLFWEVWQRLEKDYLDKSALEPEKMVLGAIKGMTQSLGDPYTVFLEPEENKRAKEDLNGSFEGVGIQLGYKDKRLVVIAPLKGTPAEKAGVKSGDLILRIVDKKKEVDQETTGISLPEAVNLIRGPAGQPVTLTLLSEGEEKSREVEIVRKTIIVPSVEVDFIDSENGEIAHLKLLRFGERTDGEWNEAISKIKKPASRDSFGMQKSKVKGIVLDVRNNPGGYLNGAVFIASEFLANGVVVKQEGKEGTKTYSVDRRGKLLEYPLVVLVNKGSASASEIAAGALRDHGRAKIVGERTFGKGTVQEAQELPGGAGLHITTARWLLPLGTWIGEEGIEPDFVVELDEKKEGDEQLEKAIEILLLTE